MKTDVTKFSDRRSVAMAIKQLSHNFGKYPLTGSAVVVVDPETILVHFRISCPYPEIVALFLPGILASGEDADVWAWELRFVPFHWQEAYFGDAVLRFPPLEPRPTGEDPIHLRAN